MVKKKTLAEIIISAFIAIIFISSYASISNFNNNNRGSTTSSTTVPPSTVYGFAFANASITGYNGTVTITIACSNATMNQPVSNLLNGMMGNLQKNNSVYNFYSIQNQILIQTGSLNAPQLYNYTQRNLNATAKACMKFSTNANIYLPPKIKLFLQGQSYNLTLTPIYRSYQIPVFITPNMSATIPVKVSALVTLNGTIWTMNVTKLS